MINAKTLVQAKATFEKERLNLAKDMTTIATPKNESIVTSEKLKEARANFKNAVAKCVKEYTDNYNLKGAFIAEQSQGLGC